MTETGKHAKTLSKAGLFYLLVIYIVWGSTYLAIRVAVREGAGFTPFMLGAARVLTAGAILLLAARLRGERLRLTKNEFITLALLAALFWLGGNGLVMVGEQRADSGLAALIIASIPLWSTIIQAVVDRRVPSFALVAALLVGMSGIVLLTLPMLQTGVRGDLLAVVALIIASISWSGGTVLQSKRHATVTPLVNSGYQMLIGGVFFAVMALITNEPLPHPTTEAWLAWAYLVVFGSLLGFTSFLQALRLLPTPVVITYGYVNPVIALLLGWVILAERITPWTIAGAALILLAVYGVFRTQSARRERARTAKAGES